MLVFNFKPIKIYKMKFTPENITELQENQIFVFGSNANGNHAGGAARIAVDKFEAIEGKSEGLQGKSYAIVTLDKKMKKVSLEAISKSINALYQFATENENLEFLVTKIGCGIAGFEEKEIENIFKSKETPKNIILPIEFSKVQGFKGFDKDMRCRGFQYEENKEYSEYVEPEMCNRGLHFCPMPLDVFNYYPPVNGASYAHVESLGKISIGEDKAATDKIKIKTKLSIANLFKLHFDLTFDKVRNEIKYSKETQSTTGYEAHSSTTGYEAHSSTTGYKAHSSTTGNYAHSSTTGNHAHSSTTGNDAHSSTTGNHAHSSTTGNEAHSSTTGYKAHSSTTGYKAHSSTTGYEAHSSTTGYKAHSSTTGNYAHSSTTGYKAHSSTTGNYAHSSTTGYKAHSSTTGNYAYSSTTGNHAYSSTTGNYAHSSTTGNHAYSSTTGNYAHSSTTGYEAHSSTTGYEAHSSTTGNEAHSSTTGNEAHSSTTGKNSIASSLGINSKAKASLGNWIVLTEWERDNNLDWQVKVVKTAKIDGEVLKAGTYYQLVNGKFTEVEE